MPTAVAAARQSYADHPMVRLETAPPGPCHAVSLQETLSGTFTACATVILGLNHLLWGSFPANGTWLSVQVIAHNLARWTAQLGLGEQVVTTKTLRRRFFSLAGRLTRLARRLTLHLPQRWPWET